MSLMLFKLARAIVEEKKFTVTIRKLTMYIWNNEYLVSLLKQIANYKLSTSNANFSSLYEKIA